MNVETEALVKHMAYTWKEGGGDAMGFSWCWSSILSEIRKLEQPPTQQPDQPNGDA